MKTAKTSKAPAKTHLTAVATPTASPAGETKLLKSWETDEGVIVELHDCGDHDEVLIVDDTLGEDEDENVVTVFDCDELEELHGYLGEALAMMRDRAKGRPVGPGDEDENEDEDEEEEDEENEENEEDEGNE